MAAFEAVNPMAAAAAGHPTVVNKPVIAVRDGAVVIEKVGRGKKGGASSSSSSSPTTEAGACASLSPTAKFGLIAGGVIVVVIALAVGLGLGIRHVHPKEVAAAAPTPLLRAITVRASMPFPAVPGESILYPSVDGKPPLGISMRYSAMLAAGASNAFITSIDTQIGASQANLSSVQGSSSWPAANATRVSELLAAGDPLGYASGLASVPFDHPVNLAPLGPADNTTGGGNSARLLLRRQLRRLQGSPPSSATTSFRLSAATYIAANVAPPVSFVEFLFVMLYSDAEAIAAVANMTSSEADVAAAAAEYVRLRLSTSSVLANISAMVLTMDTIANTTGLNATDMLQTISDSIPPSLPTEVVQLAPEEDDPNDGSTLPPGAPLPSPSPSTTSSPTPSPSSSPSNTPSPSTTTTASFNSSPSPTSSVTPSTSVSNSGTPSPSESGSNSPTPSTSVSNTPTPSTSWSNTPTPSTSFSNTPTPSTSFSNTPTPSTSWSNTPSVTPSVSPTPSVTPRALEGCASGWTRPGTEGYCFRRICPASAKNWVDSNTMCGDSAQGGQAGGYLASLRSLVDWQHIAGLGNGWVGLNDRTSEAGTNGAGFRFVNPGASTAWYVASSQSLFWRSGEPNDSSNNEDCGEVAGGILNDNNCAVTVPCAICEYPPFRSCPAGFTRPAGSPTCYQRFTTAKNWTDAAAACAAATAGGYLASIRDAAEWTFVVGLGTGWIGLNDIANEAGSTRQTTNWQWQNPSVSTASGSWYWSNANSAWNGGEPNNAGSSPGEDGAEIYFSNLLNDDSVAVAKPYICEVSVGY